MKSFTLIMESGTLKVYTRLSVKSILEPCLALNYVMFFVEIL